MTSGRLGRAKSPGSFQVPCWLSDDLDSSIGANLVDLTTSASEMRDRGAPASTLSAIANRLAARIY